MEEQTGQNKNTKIENYFFPAFILNILNERHSKQKLSIQGFVYESIFIVSAVKRLSQLMEDQQLICIVNIKGSQYRSFPSKYWKKDQQSMIVLIPLQIGSQSISNKISKLGTQKKQQSNQSSIINFNNGRANSITIKLELNLQQNKIQYEIDQDTQIKYGSPIISFQNDQITVFGFHFRTFYKGKWNSPLINLGTHLKIYISKAKEAIKCLNQLQNLAKTNNAIQKSARSDIILSQSLKTYQAAFDHLLQQNKKNIETLSLNYIKNIQSSAEQGLTITQIIQKDLQIDYVTKIHQTIKSLQKDHLLCKNINKKYLKYNQDRKLYIQINTNMNKLFYINNLMSDCENPIKKMIEVIGQFFSKKRDEKVNINPLKTLFQAHQIESNIIQVQIEDIISQLQYLESKYLYMLSIFTKNSFIIHSYQFFIEIQDILRKSAQQGKQITFASNNLEYLKLKTEFLESFSLVLKYQPFVEAIKTKTQLKDNEASQGFQIQYTIASVQKLNLFCNIKGVQDILMKNIEQRWVQKVALTIQFLSSKKELKYIAKFYPIEQFSNYSFKIKSNKCAKRIKNQPKSLQKQIKEKKFLWIIHFTYSILQLQTIGILHNDLKYQNFIYNKGPQSNNFQLIDFDLAVYVPDPQKIQCIQLYRYEELISWMIISLFKRQGDKEIVDNIFFRCSDEAEKFRKQIKNVSNSEKLMSYLRQYMYYCHRHQYLKLVNEMLQNQANDKKLQGLKACLYQLKNKELTDKHFTIEYQNIIKYIKTNYPYLLSSISVQ